LSKEVSLKDKNMTSKSGFQKIPDIAIIIGIFILALALRVIFLQQINNTPLFAHLSLDDKLYDAWALEISNGDVLGRGVFYGLPLYPYFLGFIYFLFGHDIFIARLFQALLDSISCGLLYLVGRRVFGRATAVIASLIFVFYAMSFYFEGFLSSVPLAIFLNLLILLMLFSIYEKQHLVKAHLLGCLVGMSALANSSILLFLPFIMIWMFIAFKKSDAKKKVIQPLVVAACAVLIISTVTIRNYIVAKDFVPVTSHAGVTFYAGNNPKAIGTFYLPHDLGRGVARTKTASKNIAEKTLGKKLKASEVSSFWAKKGFSFIRNNPAAYLKLIFKKIYFFWWVREIPEQIPLKFVKGSSSVLRLPLFTFAIISPISILGLLLCYKGSKIKKLALYFFISSVLLSTTIYFVNSRYRMVAEPILILFAAALITTCCRKIKEGRYLYPLSVIIGSTALFFLLNGNIAIFGEEVTYSKLGMAHVSRGEFGKAEEAFKKALEINPSNPTSHYNLGTFYLQQKLYKKAIKEFTEAIRLNPNYAGAHNNIGTIYNITNQKQKAIYHFENSLRINPHQDNIRKALKSLK